MSKKDSRSGKKYGGGHTTLIPLSSTVCDILEKNSAVTKIAPGFIVAGISTIRGRRRIKITERTGGLLLSVRDNTTRQEIHIYTTNPTRVTEALIAGVKKKQVEITFS